MALGCSPKEHKERAQRYKFCFICGEQIEGKQHPYLTHCPNCGNPQHIDWDFCGWCGASLKKS